MEWNEFNNTMYIHYLEGWLSSEYLKCHTKTTLDTQFLALFCLYVRRVFSPFFTSITKYLHYLSSGPCIDITNAAGHHSQYHHLSAVYSVTVWGVSGERYLFMPLSLVGVNMY